MLNILVRIQVLNNCSIDYVNFKISSFTKTVLDNYCSRSAFVHLF